MNLRQIARDAVILLGAVPWTIAYWCMFATTLCAILANRIDPNAKRGNCWSFGLPKLAQDGGYLAVKLLNDTRIFGAPIPHCIYVKDLLPETDLVQTRPTKRRPSKLVPFWTYLFDYRLIRREVRHNEFTTRGGDL